MSTECIAPPALDEIELSMFIDGEAEQSTVDHIKSCDHCRTNAGTLSAREQEIARWLHRSTCPTPEEVRDYRLSLLGRVEESFVALHAASCPHCARDLFVLDSFMDESVKGADPITVSPLERLRLLVAELMPNQGLNPILAGVRGEDDTLLVFAVDDFQLAIEFEEDATKGLLVLKGMLTGATLTNPLAHLWQGERLVATAPIDTSLGDFVMSRLPAGIYELIISSVESQIRIPELNVEW